MCKDSKICTELGADPTKWDKYAPLRLPTWTANSLDIFLEAVNLFLQADRAGCLAAIENTRGPEIANWYIQHGQNTGKFRKEVFGNAPLPDMQPLDKKRKPSDSLEDDVFYRDFYKCRYCDNRLISQNFFKVFIKKLNSLTFQKGKKNLEIHGIILLTWPFADHVVAHKLGGRTDLSNLVASCYSCNFGKAQYTVEQLGIENPFNRPPVHDGWNGLTDKIALLKKMTHLNSGSQYTLPF